MGSEWKKVRLSEIGKIVTGKTPPTKNKENFGDKYPFITPRDMRGQKYIRYTERYLSDIGFNLLESVAIPPNSICVTCIGSMGKIAMSSELSITNQQINSIIPNDEYDPSFIYYCLKPKEDYFKSISGGTTMPILNKTDFSNIEIEVPPLPEQQKIASILSAFDDKIELNNEMNKTLEEIAQAIFKHWFIDFEFPNENGEPYKSSGGEFVDSELGPIPKGWEVERLGDLIKFIKGKKPSDISERKRSNYLLYLTIDVIKGNTILYANPAKTVIANKFDILMVMDGASSGDIYCGVEGIVASTISKLEIVNSHIPEEFVYYLLKDKKIEISKHTTGTAIPHVDKGFVSSIKVAIPKEKEILNDFKNKVRLIRRKIIANNEQNHVLYQLRDTLLPKLISGEIRVM